MSTSTYTVRGMTCDHCASSVRAEVETLPGVVDVRVDLATGRLDVTTNQDVAPAAIRGAIADAGYGVAPLV